MDQQPLGHAIITNPSKSFYLHVTVYIYTLQTWVLIFGAILIVNLET